MQSHIHHVLFNGLQVSRAKSLRKQSGDHDKHVEIFLKIAANHAFGMVATFYMTTMDAESHPPCLVQLSACFQKLEIMITMFLLH